MVSLHSLTPHASHGLPPLSGFWSFDLWSAYCTPVLGPLISHTSHAPLFSLPGLRSSYLGLVLLPLSNSLVRLLLRLQVCIYFMYIFDHVCRRHFCRCFSHILSENVPYKFLCAALSESNESAKIRLTLSSLPDLLRCQSERSKNSTPTIIFDSIKRDLCINIESAEEPLDSNKSTRVL